ncbi:MAG: aromatic acid exporter family protein [Spirochaetales bacterium]|nr:aromatic acid exporter family protein [Spirochaetales bacterium]
MNRIITSTKIILAAILAIAASQFLKLDFAISAGIVAILSVQPTKKETLSTALSRFQAFVVALAISFVCYKFLGFTVYAFFVYLIVFIFICQHFKWHSAMAMDSVLISHFITLNNFGIAELKNELLLFIVGVGFGILANIFLHKKTDKIERLKNIADQQIREILSRMSMRIMDLDFSGYTGECFIKLDKAITDARIFARENANNQFLKVDVFDEKYIEMREAQKEILKEIYRCIIELRTVPSTASKVSAFFKKVSVEYEKNNDVLSLIQELSNLHEEMKKIKLPENRPEFEDRALLFIMLKRMKDFLMLKRNFHSQYISSNGKSK